MPKRALKKEQSSLSIQNESEALSTHPTIKVRDGRKPLKGNELARLAGLVKRAQNLKHSGVTVELEAKIGFMHGGTFVAGVCQGRFRFLLEWLIQSNLSASKWEESVVTHKGSCREIVNKRSCTIECHEKKRIEDVVLLSTHPEGVCFKFSLSTEEPTESVEVKQSVAPTSANSTVRLRQRRSFGIPSTSLSNGEEAFRVDFTLAWMGKSERIAKERQRQGTDTTREVEIELVSTDYLLKHEADHVAESLYAKVASLFSSEMPETRDFDVEVVSFRDKNEP